MSKIQAKVNQNLRLMSGREVRSPATNSSNQSHIYISPTVRNPTLGTQATKHKKNKHMQALFTSPRGA